MLSHYLNSKDLKMRSLLELEHIMKSENTSKIN